MSRMTRSVCLEKVDGYRGATIIQNTSPHSTIKSPTSTTSCCLKSPVSMKSEPLSGKKRTLSCWREIRSRLEPGAADPYDEFLDTPLENIKENLTKDLKQTHDHPVQPPKGMDLDSSDDETQDLNGESSVPNQPISIARPGDRGFKYVEPVRKKADRENLKGIECKQCKKFYDAVLSDGDKNNNNNDDDDAS